MSDTRKLESDVRVLKEMVERIIERIKVLESTKVLCLTASWDLLTPSQIVCLQYVALGFSNKQIAEKIGRSRSTVTSHIFEASKRLGTRSRSGAVIECYRRGLLVRVIDTEREGVA